MRSKFIILAFRLAARFPLRLSQFIGALLGHLFYLFPTRERAVTRVNLALCFPELSEEARERRVKASLIETGKTLVEMPGSLLGPHADAWAAGEPGDGFEKLQEVLDRGRGVIVAGPHMGNWEVALRHLTTRSKVTALYRTPRVEGLDHFIRDGRSRSGANLVPASVQGVKSLFQALRRREIMGILPDQQPKGAGDKGGVFAPFFGQDALTMLLVNRLARKTGAPVLFWYAERLPKGRGFRLHCLEAPEGIDDADPVVAATALNQGIEACIRRCPDQYLWSYKRFSLQPEGKNSPYKRRG